MGSSLALHQKNFVCKNEGLTKESPLEFFRHYATHRSKNEKFFQKTFEFFQQFLVFEVFCKGNMFPESSG